MSSVRGFTHDKLWNFVTQSGKRRGGGRGTTFIPVTMIDSSESSCCCLMWLASPISLMWCWSANQYQPNWTLCLRPMWTLVMHRFHYYCIDNIVHFPICRYTIYHNAFYHIHYTHPHPSPYRHLNVSCFRWNKHYYLAHSDIGPASLSLHSLCPPATVYDLLHLHSSSVPHRIHHHHCLAFSDRKIRISHHCAPVCYSTTDNYYLHSNRSHRCRSHSRIRALDSIGQLHCSSQQLRPAFGWNDRERVAMNIEWWQVPHSHSNATICNRCH